MNLESSGVSKSSHPPVCIIKSLNTSQETTINWRTSSVHKDTNSVSHSICVSNLCASYAIDGHLLTLSLDKASGSPSPMHSPYQLVEFNKDGRDPVGTG
ncbi:hypothetical protein VNO78_23308 [Psophocarpus tetragonolobus]|uniref:Uncharacterized protein n=1 Tax=Psophocarpus tetragonolobus TaxID=3891 RepID=A0AAN9S3Y1_PSOTE